MIFHGRFLTKHDGLSTDSASRLKRSTTKRKVASERQLVSVEFRNSVTNRSVIHGCFVEAAKTIRVTRLLSCFQPVQFPGTEKTRLSRSLAPY